MHSPITYYLRYPFLFVPFEQIVLFLEHTFQLLRNLIQSRTFQDLHQEVRQIKVPKRTRNVRCLNLESGHTPFVDCSALLKYTQKQTAGRYRSRTEEVVFRLLFLFLVLYSPKRKARHTCALTKHPVSLFQWLFCQLYWTYTLCWTEIQLKNRGRLYKTVSHFLIIIL